MSTNEMPKAYEPNDVENKWYPVWEDRGCFKGNPDSGKKPYSIVIPPPNVTGILTMGHVLNNTLQDILIRWRRMQGYEACWFPGTDHAGIATETRVDKQLRENEGHGRDHYGREEFVKRVWEWREQYGHTIIKQLRKLGTSCDWERERFTMDEGLNKAVMLVFVKLYEKGYIYRGRRMINWCPVSKTALSDEEVIYKEVHGYFYHFKYPLSDGSGHLVIATTRPETMLGDSAVAVNPADERYKNIIGKTIDLPLTSRKIPVIADEHADPLFGTGCVKITPAHDPNDFEVGLRHKLQVLNVMNADATMNEAAGEEFVGLDRFECREKIVKLMQDANLVVKIEDHMHSVGYSERGDVPIEPRVSEQWFVDMKELAKPAISAVKSGEIKFYPDRWTKTYFHWMENIKDWCISRQIWWGHRIPAWYHKKTGKIFVGLEAPKDIENWVQDEDVLDTWFSSWLWPFSIMGWPEETKEQKFFYPTSDLVTGPDIIFFWVARMIMAGYEFKGALPFKNVYFTSIIRDETGRKLSKSLGNSPDPLDVIRTYGADALRFSIIYIAPLGMDIRYSNEKCEIGRNFANKLWNASRFRRMQGDIVPFNISSLESADLSQDDKWMLGRLNQVVTSVNESLENFRFHDAVHGLYEFVWGEFCDWYIEVSKENFFNKENTEKRNRGLGLFDYAMFTILKLLHPFMPFVTEELAHQLGYLADDSSIMLAEFPKPMESAKLAGLGISDGLIKRVVAKFAIISAGRNLRVSCSIAPSLKIKYFIKPVDAGTEKFLQEQKSSLEMLLRAESLVIDANFAASGPAPSIVTDAGTIFMPLEGLVDVAAELAKLEKQKKELDSWIAGTKAKLSNERFVGKAPPKVIEDSKKLLAENEDKLCRVEDMIRALGK
ncbi:MAG: valine--tRNA ligase [Victivallales bacterium]